MRRREVRCEWIRDGEAAVEVEEQLCPEGDRPEDVQPCQQEACQYDWKHGEWGACDVPCGEGWKEREVWCEKQGGVVSHEALCGASDKPDRLDICHTPNPCSDFLWTTSEWNEVKIYHRDVE